MAAGEDELDGLLDGLNVLSLKPTPTVKVNEAGSERQNEKAWRVEETKVEEITNEKDARDSGIDKAKAVHADEQVMVGTLPQLISSKKDMAVVVAQSEEDDLCNAIQDLRIKHGKE